MDSEVGEKKFETRVADLWFDDGNIVLEASDTLYRVYRGILAARSPVFQVMVSLPQPEDIEVIENCPVVHLSDAAEDVTYFLKAIFDSGFFEPPPSKTELGIVSGVLRLSTKYDVQYLRKRALMHLTTVYPPFLDRWTVRETERTIPPIDNTPFAVLRVAREFDIAWILPAVLYCICSYNVSDILDGVSWCGSHVDVNPDDRRRCLIARSELFVVQQKSSFKFLRMNEFEDCVNIRDCDLARFRWLDIVANWDVADPLDIMDENWKGLVESLCEPCYAASRQNFMDARQSLWNELPRILDLPEWEVLLKAKAVAME